MDLRAKKSLGQHFLTSQPALAKIIEAARLGKGEAVLEIGPGTGILTQALLDAGANVIAVEKDDRALMVLQEKFSANVSNGSLKLIHGDILEQEREALGLVDSKYALIANIPYYITGMILQSFLEHAPRPNRMVLLVQKEVAERIVARDGKESILSISVKAFGEPRLIAKVPRGAFNPPPTVDSAILAIEHVSAARFAEKGLQIRRFFDILKAGFAHKRKILKRNLEIVFSPDQLDQIWNSAGFSNKKRAEEMTTEDWFAICTS